MKGSRSTACAAVVLAGLLAALLLPGRAQATQVFNTDFESGIPAEFSAPGCVIDGVQGWAGLGAVGNQFSGSFLHYTAVQLFDTKLTLHNLPPHDHISLSFLLAVIDSWDGTELLKVSIDGVEVFSNWFLLSVGDESSYVAPPGGVLSSGTDLGFTDYNSYFWHDRAYDMSVEPVFNSIPHTADSLTVVWYLGAVSGTAAANWQGTWDESWAIENVRVDATSSATGIGAAPSPTALTLLSNSPNPFQGNTTFRVASAVDANAQIEVFDVNGRRVRSGSAHLAAGWQDMEFDGRDDHNQPLATGVYFYRLRAAGETRTQKFVVMR